MNINDYCEQAHETAVDKGWWNEERSFPEQIALMHSELSEALEHWRNGNGGFPMHHIWYTNDNKPDGIAVELADVLIRIFDTCAKYQIDLERALSEKMAYNNTRAYRHGGKKA